MTTRCAHCCLHQSMCFLIICNGLEMTSKTKKTIHTRIKLLKTWLLDQKTIKTEFPPFQSHPQYLFSYLNTSIYELRNNNAFDTLRMLPVFSWFAGSNLANDIFQNQGVFGLLHTLVSTWSNCYISVWRRKMKGAPENAYIFFRISSRPRASWARWPLTKSRQKGCRSKSMPRVDGDGLQERRIANRIF